MREADGIYAKVISSKAAGSRSANCPVCVDSLPSKRRKHADNRVCAISGNDRVNETRKLDSLRYDCRTIARSLRRSAAPSLIEEISLESSKGNLTVNTVPFPTSLFASILPPCESTIHLTIDRPSPKPAAVRSAVLADRRKNLS